MNLIENKLRVVHFPQVGCPVDPFIVEVMNEREAFLIKETLANQHCYLFDNNFIPDYSNVILVEMFEEDSNDWFDYYNEAEEMDWKQYSETYFEAQQCLEKI